MCINIDMFLSAKYCPTPPDPVVGGIHDLNALVFNGNQTPYAHKVTYSCDRGRMFNSSDGVLYPTHEKTCLWNQTWSPETEVSALHQNYVLKHNPGKHSLYSLTIVRGTNVWTLMCPWVSTSPYHPMSAKCPVTAMQHMHASVGPSSTTTGT